MAFLGIRAVFILLLYFSNVLYGNLWLKPKQWGLSDVEISFFFVINGWLYTCISDWLFMWDLSLTALDLSYALSQVNYASSSRIMCLSYWQIDHKRFQLFCRCNLRIFVYSTCILQHSEKEQRELLNLRNWWYIR